MAGVAPVNDDLEASNGDDGKYLELLQSVAFKVAICIVTVTSGVIQNSPVGDLRRASDRKVLSTAYVVAMFLSFSLGLALLLLSIPHLNAVELSPMVVRMLMLVCLGFVYTAVAIGTVIALMEV